MQTTKYSCGPAALATVLQNMGFNVTEHELKVLAGTDETGTSMYGLAQAAQAAQSKGLSVAGMRLSIDELRPNMIVHVIKDGTPHYSVVREVTNESVRLADPSLGNIELTREKFNEIYTGNALVMEAPGVSVNETSANNSLGNIEITRVSEIYTGNALVMEAPGVSVNETSANNTDAVSAQPETLADEEMESIKGQQLSVSAPVTSSMKLSAETMQSIRGKFIKVAIGIIIAGKLIAFFGSPTPKSATNSSGPKRPPRRPRKK